MTELFFRFNATYLWFVPKSVRFQPAEGIAAEPLPPGLLKAAQKIKVSPQWDQSTFTIIDSLRSEKKRVAEPGFVFAGNFITFERNQHKPRVIHEKINVRSFEIIDTVYSFDENHIRVSTDRPYEQGKKNILLLGCSYAFGQSVPDNETITAFLAKDFPQYNIYNLGVPAGGLTNILNDIYYKDRISAIGKKGGAVIYEYWYDHFGRHFSDLRTLRENYPTQGTLEYQLVDGKLKATEKSGLSELKLAALKFLAKSEFLYFTGWGYNTYSMDYQKQFLDYLEFIKNYYQTEFNLEFYLFVKSQYDIPSQYFYDQLKARNIKTILYDSFTERISAQEVTIPADHHFNARGNYIYSQLLRKRLLADGF